MIRFSPQAMQRLRAYEDELKRRIRKHELTNEEAYTLLQGRVRDEAGGVARKVRCPDCGATHRVVGNGQTFQCCTQKVHSVWDYRMGT